MMDFLLFHLMSGTDLDWLFSVAKAQKIEPNQIIPQSNTDSNQVHFGIGNCAIVMPHQHQENLREVMQASAEGIAGAMPGLEGCFSTTRFEALEPCQVLSIDAAQLAEKLSDDQAFAAHFYHYQAVLVMQYMKAVVQQFNLNPVVLYQINVKEALSLFAELQDRHLDWLIAVGQRQQLSEGSILQRMNRPIENLQIVLDGSLSLNLPARSDLPDQQNVAQEIARLGRGDIFGEMRSLQCIATFYSVPPFQVQTLRDTEVLAVPYWRIFSKVLHDVEFALHYYRTLAQFMASKYQTILTKLGFLTAQAMQEHMSDRGLERVAKAEANFEWMVQRLQSKVLVGSEIEWSSK